MSKDQLVEPKSLDQYQVWLVQHYKDFNYELARNRYEILTNEIRSDIEKSDLWQEYISALKNLNSENLTSFGFPLLMSEDVTLKIKPWDSFYLRSYRRNYLDNPSFPEPPPKVGWHNPSLETFGLSDVFRCMVIVKYLDGVKILEDRQNNYFSSKNMKHRTYFEARETGYYACHSYLDYLYSQNSQIYKIEIQITTQLQENIKQLTHRYYDMNRRKKIKKSEKWQWEHNSPEFDANYLGHILHYLEAVILRVRESK